MLAKILSQRHGFKTSVLFSVDPDGTINPKAATSLSDPATLDTADAVVMLLRFRTWPDETMERFDRLPARGKTHRGAQDEHARIQRFSERQPLGVVELQQQRRIRKRVLGETRLTHWGRTQDRSDSRDRGTGAEEPSAASRRDGDLRRHGRLRSLPASRRDDPRPGFSCSKIADAVVSSRGLITKPRARPTSRNRASTIRRCLWCGRARTRTRRERPTGYWQRRWDRRPIWRTKDCAA